MCAVRLTAAEGQWRYHYFCGACLLSIKEQMGLVYENVCTSLDGAPFLIAFTFGEQGYAVDQTNRHGNLMYATVLFGEDDADC